MEEPNPAIGYLEAQLAEAEAARDAVVAETEPVVVAGLEAQARCQAAHKCVSDLTRAISVLREMDAS